jgi:hypothetical protein
MLLVRLFRQIFSVLLVAAYVSATILTVAPVAIAAPAETPGMTMKTGMSDRMPMPCEKNMKPGCVTELGCIFMVSLPAPDLSLGAVITWSPATYSVAPDFLSGLSIPPLLGPPISRT